MLFLSYVVVELRGANALLFIGAMQRRGWPIRHIEKKSDYYLFTCTLKIFFSLRPLLRKYHVRVRIQKKKGLYAFLRRLSLRPFLLWGALGALLLYLWSFSLIWNVQLTGEISSYEELVRIWLMEKNLYPGRAIAALDTLALSEELLIDFPALSFAQLTMRGVTLEVEIYQTIPPKPSVEIGKELPLLADRAGKVTSLTVLRGTPAVKVGTWVEKGEVLIYGHTPLTQTPVQAQGEVILTNWIEESITLPLYEEREVPSGRSCLKKQLKIGKWPLLSKQIGPQIKGKDSKSKQFSRRLTNFFPLVYSWTFTQEVQKCKVAKDFKDASFQAQSRAQYLLFHALDPDCVLVDKWVEMNIIKDEKVCCRVVMEVAKAVSHDTP